MVLNRRTVVAAVAALCFAGLSLPCPAAYGSSHAAPRTRSDSPHKTLVDINHATLDELLGVPGMTRTWAGRIIRFRPYHAKNDLILRGVVTSEVYARIRDFVIAHRDARR
ncbi:MAG TPA: helix-hairpin-helix domain-containing protein [Terracidiphilus sp.]|nr:helix-hairpin-helix domain-containing protein [Terracidiphilus sp.]